MRKRLLIIFVTIVIAFGVSISVFAESDSFVRIETENDTVITVNSRNVFKTTKCLTGASLKAEEQLTGITDIFVSENGFIYLLCSESSRILKLNSDYNLEKEISLKNTDGNEIDFKGAQGLYVEDDDKIYLADTENSQVIITDNDGKCIKIWEQPQSDIIPEGFIYNPAKIIRNSDGYTYILSRGCYYGTLVYNPEGKFSGFMGANTVKATVLDAISNIYKRLTTTEEKQTAAVKNLPYSFVDFVMDKEGYIVTCTGSTDPQSNGVGQIRKINNSGANILFKTYSSGNSVNSAEYNFLEKKIIKKSGQNQIQNIVSVDVDENGFLYALDRTFGFIYVYDSDCNFITGFGGLGDSQGLFTDPVSIAVTKNGLLVADTKAGVVTVFEITEFGKKLYKAQCMYLNGEYTDAKPLWEDILSQDRYNQPAYRGLAMISYNNGNYKKALEFAKIGYDYTVYDMAYQKVLTNFIEKYFAVLILILVVLIGVCVFAVLKIQKNQKILIKNEKIKTVCSVAVHPFNTFDDIKYYGKGSMLIAVIFTVLFYLASAFKSTFSGFLFLNQAPEDFNAYFTLLKTIGLIALWCLANWLVCALLSGNGKLKEVFIATVYALIPYILWTVVSVVLTWILPLSGAGLINGINTVMLIYTFFLLSVAMMKIHDFNFFRFLLTSAVTVIGMLFIVFIIFMIIILLQQFWNMLYAVFTEAFYR